MIALRVGMLSVSGICKITIGWWGRSVRTWSAKWWALRVGMKYECHEQDLWNCHSRGRSAGAMLGDLQVQMWDPIHSHLWNQCFMGGGSAGANVRWSAGAAWDPINSHLWNQYVMGDRSANTWSAKCWALRVGMKSVESVKLPSDEGGRSAKTCYA